MAWGAHAKESCFKHAKDWGHHLEAEDSLNAEFVARAVSAGDNFVLNVPPHASRCFAWPLEEEDSAFQYRNPFTKAKA